MKNMVRKAQVDDVAAMVALSEQKRLEYQQLQPHFWRKAADSRERQTPYFARLVGSESCIALVLTRDNLMDGFIMGLLIEAPPVYDPGGLTCVVDDFVVADANDWQIAGAALLDEVGREARARGAVQTVVVCAHLDQPKRAMLLQQAGFSIASEWHVREN